MHGEPFTLDTNYRPKRRNVKGENNPNTRQTVLFAGMDLLPGQTDLFPTDGKEPTPEHFCALCDEAVECPVATACGMFERTINVLTPAEDSTLTVLVNTPDLPRKSSVTAMDTFEPGSSL